MQNPPRNRLNIAPVHHQPTTFYRPVKAFVVVVGGLSVARVAAQSSVGKDEKALCLKTINDLTNGKPPPSAVKLCSEGKTEEAVKKAMAAQGG